MNPNRTRETVMTASPFLNNYKRDFVNKRLLQTFLGGPILKFNSDIDVPWFIYFLQILLFIMPFLIGGTCILIGDLLKMDNWNLYISIIAGVAYFIYLISIKIFSIIINNKSYAKEIQTIKNKAKSNKILKKTNLLNDEQNYNFDKFFSSKTVEFILPTNDIFIKIENDVASKKINAKKLIICMIKILIDSIIAGFIMFCSVYFESINYLQKFYSIGPSVILFIFHWILLLITFYSLTIRAPPEPAIYQSYDQYNIQHYTRPFYVLCFQILEFVFNFSANNACIPSSVIFYTKIFFSFLPIAWFFGFLLPIDAFFLWFFEQCYIFLYGGTATATNLRLIIQLLLAVIVSMVHFIPNDIAIVVLLSAFGYILSSFDFIYIFEWIKEKSNDSKRSKISPSNSIKSKRKPYRMKFPLKSSDLLYHLVLFILTVGVSVCVFTLFDSNFKDKDTSFQIETILLYICIGLFVICKILGDLQGVYLFFGLIRNPFYPKNSLTQTIKNSTSNSRKKILSINQNRIFFKILKYIRIVLIRIVSPLIMCTVISIDCYLNKIYADKTFSYWRTLCVLRAYRWVWQSTYLCLFEMCTTHIILFSIAYNIETNPNTKLGIIQYFLTGCLAFSFIRDRLNQFIQKIYTFILITITAWTVKKQKRRLAILFLVLNFVFLIPITLIVIMPAAIISAPLLPLFTFPLFLIGFPRSKRFWPQKETIFSSSTNFLKKNTEDYVPVIDIINPKKNKNKIKQSNSSSESCIYAQLVPELIPSLKEMIRSASLGQAIRPDTYYLSRFQDRILWIQIMEVGHTYYIVNIKGLELQETSCHTQEAQYIDDLFDLDFENPFGANSNSDSKNKIISFNKRPFNCLNSKDLLVFKAYSDAKNSLVGILDYPENLKMFFNFYPKILHYFLVIYLIENIENLSQISNEINKSKNIESELHQEYDLVKRNEENKDGNRWMENIINEKNEEVHMFSPKPRNQINFSNKEKEKQNESSDNWSDDDDDLDYENKVKPKSPKLSSNLKKNKNSSPDPFDFDLNEILGTNEKNEAKKHNKKDSPKKEESKTEIIEMKPSKSEIKPHIAPKIETKNLSENLPKRSIITIPSDWLSFFNENLNNSQSINSEDLKESLMNRKWLEKIIDMNNTTIEGKTEQFFNDYETNIWTSHYKFLLKCCQTLGINDKTTSENFNPQSIYSFYKGDLPWTPTNEKLTKNFPELHKLLVKAFRYSVKMIIDHATISPISNDEDFFESLTEYEKDWFIGGENESDFSDNILKNKSFIFTLSRDASKKNLNSRTLSLQQIRSPLAQLNSEIVKSIWSSTNLELLYMTNDDEERYSIQAHPYILRNLTIQSSDPPLGYSVYNSDNIYLSLVNPF